LYSGKLAGLQCFARRDDATATAMILTPHSSPARMPDFRLVTQTLDSRLFLSFLGVAAHFHAVDRCTF
jgi:hypothetical protein